MTDNTRELRIGQLNCQRSKTVMSEVIRVAQELQLDIVCAQEPYTQNGKIPVVPPTARVIAGGERPGAVTVVFNRAIGVTLTSANCVCVELASEAGRWILINQYYKF